MKHRSSRLIDVEEFVPINGARQYLFHSGKSHENPVLLFLHGGPGTAESLFAHTFQDKWEDIFTVVHWDQRGSGKTLTKNPDSYPTVDLLLEDLLQIIHHLKSKYHTDKVILLGHSWGSVLGTIFIRQHPQEVDYYIGVGQVVNFLMNERVGYAKVKELIVQANDERSLRKLEAIGEYPGDKTDSEWLKKCIEVRKLQGKYSLAVKSNLTALKVIITSPVFKLSDLPAMGKGLKANRHLFDFLASFDLSADLSAYKVPVYYILGENDWQTPYVMAEEYFKGINAPRKGFYMVPDAGHMTMLEQPDRFFDILTEIRRTEGEEPAPLDSL